MEGSGKNKDMYCLVCIVHCETSSGVINEVSSVAELFPDVNFFVDAMSSFGAVPIDLKDAGWSIWSDGWVGLTLICDVPPYARLLTQFANFLSGRADPGRRWNSQNQSQPNLTIRPDAPPCTDFVVSSANKCLEGVPGFGYALCRKSKLERCRGNSRSLSLDLYEQKEGLDKNGQFRFTPPTHTMLAFRKALEEFKEQGGNSIGNNFGLIFGLKSGLIFHFDTEPCLNYQFFSFSLV